MLVLQSDSSDRQYLPQAQLAHEEIACQSPQVILSNGGPGSPTRAPAFISLFVDGASGPVRSAIPRGFVCAWIKLNAMLAQETTYGWLVANEI